MHFNVIVRLLLLIIFVVVFFRLREEIVCCAKMTVGVLEDERKIEWRDRIVNGCESDVIKMAHWHADRMIVTLISRTDPCK